METDSDLFGTHNLFFLFFLSWWSSGGNLDITKGELEHHIRIECIYKPISIGSPLYVLFFVVLKIIVWTAMQVIRSMKLASNECPP